MHQQSGKGSLLYNLSNIKPIIKTSEKDITLYRETVCEQLTITPIIVSSPNCCHIT